MAIGFYIFTEKQLRNCNGYSLQLEPYQATIDRVDYGKMKHKESYIELFGIGNSDIIWDYIKCTDNENGLNWYGIKQICDPTTAKGLGVYQENVPRVYWTV